VNWRAAAECQGWDGLKVVSSSSRLENKNNTMLTELQDRFMAAAYRFRLRTWFSGKPQRNQRISNPWHAVSVVSADGTCKAVRAMRERRYLSTEAPQLPLAGCERPEACKCRYAHHSDRRTGKRRARDNGFPARAHSGEERRADSRGRRATDGYDTRV